MRWAGEGVRPPPSISPSLSLSLSLSPSRFQRSPPTLQTWMVPSASPAPMRLPVVLYDTAVTAVRTWAGSAVQFGVCLCVEGGRGRTQHGLT